MFITLTWCIVHRSVLLSELYSNISSYMIWFRSDLFQNLSTTQYSWYIVVIIHWSLKFYFLTVFNKLIITTCVFNKTEFTNLVIVILNYTRNNILTMNGSYNQTRV